MDLYLVGIDHHVAPLEVRERLAIPKAQVPELLKQICERSWADEAMLVATCNRTELYVATAAPDGSELALEVLADTLPGARDLDPSLFRLREGETAAHHLFRVAAGLESAILGETEIQGQVSEAHERALEAGTAGRVLDRLARGALHAGKRVRSETAIAAGGVSHGSAAARVAQRIFGTVDGRSVLVVGAGAMARQTALALAGDGIGSYVVANRTAERAQELADELPRRPSPAWRTSPPCSPRPTSRSSRAGAPRSTKQMVRGALTKRREPLLVVDLCVPRLAEEAIGDLPGVFLYDLEALEEMVAGSLARRREAVADVETLLAQEFTDFRAWYRTLEVLPAIHSIQEWAETIRQKELGYLPAQVNGEVRAAVEKMTRRLVNKLLARPTSRVVRGMEKDDPSMPTPDHLRSVFGLGEKEKDNS